MNTFAEENYLKAILSLSLQGEELVSTNSIAAEMNTSAASVSDMLKKLQEKKLIIYKKYKGVALNKQGKSIAVNILRKHRLWETFLVKKLDFNWDEVHDVAEQLEHIKSPKLINQLDALLGFPTHDPHGDPIPDKDGNVNTVDKILLSTFNKDESGVCVGVNDSSSEFLRFLDKKKITLGKKITVLEKEDFDDSLSIEIDGEKLSISKKIASNLYIKK